MIFTTSSPNTYFVLNSIYLNLLLTCSFAYWEIADKLFFPSMQLNYVLDILEYYISTEVLFSKSTDDCNSKCWFAHPILNSSDISKHVKHSKWNLTYQIYTQETFCCWLGSWWEGKSLHISSARITVLNFQQDPVEIPCVMYEWGQFTYSTVRF